MAKQNSQKTTDDSKTDNNITIIKITNNNNSKWSQWEKYPTFCQQKSNELKFKITGSCHCKGIMFGLIKTPTQIQNCYCSICRKIHGSALASWSPIKEMCIKFIKHESLVAYQSSSKVKRGFCNVCGANIFLKYEYQKGTLWLATGVFDDIIHDGIDNESIKRNNWHSKAKKWHIYCNSASDWFKVPNDGLKRSQ